MSAVLFDMSSLEPRDHTTVRWVLLHRHEGGSTWFCTWVGDLRIAGTEAAKEAETEAHKALDRAYAGPLETRLVKQTHRTIRQVEDVPAMWET